MFKSIEDKNVSIYDDRNLEDDEKDTEDLVRDFNDIPISFATIDLEHIDLREFNKTYLAKVLNKYEIPYFTIELPYYVKEHFSKNIIEIKNKLNELKAGYDILEIKNTSNAKELMDLIDHYSNELEALNRHINLEIRTNAIMKKILFVIKGREDKVLDFLHIGDKSTFIESMKLLKAFNVKSNVIFVQKSRFL